MKPQRIFLIRHAQSAANIDDSLYRTMPDCKIPLSDIGKQQAVEVGRWLRSLIVGDSVRFYVSPYLRAQQTYEYLVESWTGIGFRVSEEPRLREQDWGNLKSHPTIAEVEEGMAAVGKFYFRIPNGESGADVYDRVSTFLETLHRDFKNPSYPQNAILVTHGLTMRLFLMRWFHWRVSELEASRNPPNCYIARLVLGVDEKYTLDRPLP